MRSQREARSSPRARRYVRSEPIENDLRSGHVVTVRPLTFSGPADRSVNRFHVRLLPSP